MILEFKRGSFITWKGQSLGYSRDLVVIFDDNTEILTNQKLTFPVDVDYKSTTIRIRVRLGEFEKYQSFLLSNFMTEGTLVIRGRVIGENYDRVFTFYRAKLISRGNLNFSDEDGVIPEFEWIALYDFNTNKVFDISL